MANNFFIYKKFSTNCVGYRYYIIAARYARTGQSIAPLKGLAPRGCAASIPRQAAHRSEVRAHGRDIGDGRR